MEFPADFSSEGTMPMKILVKRQVITLAGFANRDQAVPHRGDHHGFLG